MKVRFKFSCCACNCYFELESDRFANREHMECPNCGQVFPRKEFFQIKQAMNSIQCISEECAESSSEKGFHIQIVSIENAGELPF